MQIQYVIFIIITIVNGQEICKLCECDDSTKLINCSNRNLTLAFNRTELWLDSVTNQTINVNEFNFNNNNLIHVYPFPKLNIKKLILSSNRIIKIEKETFKCLMDMHELDLSDNNLMSVYLTSDVFMGPYAPEDSEPLRSLHILRLSRNALHSLHPDLFEHTDRIEVLMLDNNPFSVIDRVTLIALSTLPRLKVLDLSYTDIKTLPQYLLHTPMYLTHLNLSGNEIQILPKTLGDVHNLEWLSLDNNPIEALNEPDNLFPVIPSLKILHMSYMPRLTAIAEFALNGLHNLEQLYINENKKLHFIDSKALSRMQFVTNTSRNEIEIWPPIVKLELSGNNLTTIEYNLIGNWAHLQLIDIRFNRFVCDCNNQWIIDILIPLIQGLRNQQLLNGINCLQPDEMKHRNFTELYEHGVHMRCLDKYGSKPELDASILVGILIGVLVTIPIMMAIIVFCYKRNYCGLVNKSQNPADFSRNFYKRAESDDNYM